MSETKVRVEELTIDGTVYVPKETVNQLAKANTTGLIPVLIRSYAAGVHFGFLKSEEHFLSGKEVVLVNTKRIHFWEGACSLSQIALESVKNTKDTRISVEIQQNTISNVIEVMPLTELAFNHLNSIPIWKK